MDLFYIKTSQIKTKNLVTLKPRDIICALIWRIAEMWEQIFLVKSQIFCDTAGLLFYCRR